MSNTFVITSCNGQTVSQNQPIPGTSQSATLEGKFDGRDVKLTLPTDLLKSYMTSEKREETYTDETKKFFKTKGIDFKELARNGFVSVKAVQKDKVQCVVCKGKLHSFEPGDKIEEEHKKNFPRCAALQHNTGYEFTYDKERVQPETATGTTQPRTKTGIIDAFTGELLHPQPKTPETATGTTQPRTKTDVIDAFTEELLPPQPEPKLSMDAALQLLRKNHPHLVNKMSNEQRERYMDELISTDALTDSMADEINSKPTTREKNRALIDTMKRRGEEHLDQFVTMLNQDKMLPQVPEK